MNTTTIKCWWDTQDPKNHGWYWIMRDRHGATITDSLKVGELDPDEYGHDEARELEAALIATYPDADVEIVEP